MNKFALIGRDISHSKSPEIYRKLISPKIEYDLLDYKESCLIPSARILLDNYDGINITSPYKKHFLEQIDLTPIALQVGAINCLKKSGDKIIGENTDYLAIVDILKELIETNKALDIVILGDGVMSRVVQVALRNLYLSAQVLSRKSTSSFDQLNLNQYFRNQEATPLVINTCAREYVFKGELPKNSFFWDFNYNFPQHSQYFFHKIQKYFDGLDMLERQAFYAVAFWSNHKII
jgi:shikimate dehydrogenase